MNWRLPNQLTVARIALSAVFFVLLGMYHPTLPCGPLLLNIAFVIYIVAGITDVLDGYFARKWNVVSAFGRIADPFVDKVLVVGAFAMLAGSNFAMADPLATTEGHLDMPQWWTGHMVSAVQAWMVVVIMSREFIVSAVRGYSESQGMKFPATSAGKIKMFIQSVAICTVLFQIANLPDAAWAACVKVALVWLATVATVLSSLGYIKQTRRLLASDE